MARIIEQEIAELIEQSEDIAKQVRLENWDSVEQLTEIRQQNLENFFKTPVRVEHAKSVAKMIRTILDADHGLIEFIDQEKKQTFKQFANLKMNNKANNTYQNVASLNFS